MLEHLANLKVGIWQMLPVNRVDDFGCPYSSPSAFSCEPRLLGLEWFVEQDLLDPRDLPAQDKKSGLQLAYRNFADGKGSSELRADYEIFRRLHDSWLIPLADWLGDRTREFEPFLEFSFRRQWRVFRERAEQLGIRLVGDVPIFVGLNSVDVQIMGNQFKLDESGRPLVVAGVPPDAFSASGQNWQAPVYDWEKMKADHWSWWRKRVALQFDLFHTLRLDHFRGFAATWEIPAGARDARKGKWVIGGGHDLLSALCAEQPDSDGFIAEDLGVITPDVDELRESFRFPTMKVQQFHWRERFPKHCVAYTGTHDNDTLWGWHGGLTSQEKSELYSALNLTGSRITKEEFVVAMIAQLLSSDADWCVVTAQDLLCLGSEARMNTPSTTTANWRWRLGENQFQEGNFDWLKTLIERTKR